MAEQSAGGAATRVLGALVSATLGGLTWLSAGATGVDPCLDQVGWT
jgi:hypothetical protein